MILDKIINNFSEDSEEIILPSIVPVSNNPDGNIKEAEDNARQEAAPHALIQVALNFQHYRMYRLWPALLLKIPFKNRQKRILFLFGIQQR